MAEAKSNTFWAETSMVPRSRDSNKQVAKRGTSDEVIKWKIAKDAVETLEFGIEFVDDYTTCIDLIYSFGDHFPISVCRVRLAAADPPGQSVENQPIARHTSLTSPGSMA